MKAKQSRMELDEKPLLGITLGDPAGIGPEVIAKALAGCELQKFCLPLVVGSYPVMARTVKALRLKLNVVRADGHDPASAKGNTVVVLDPLERPLKKFKPALRTFVAPM